MESPVLLLHLGVGVAVDMADLMVAALRKSRISPCGAPSLIQSVLMLWNEDSDNPMPKINISTFNVRVPKCKSSRGFAPRQIDIALHDGPHRALSTAPDAQGQCAPNRIAATMAARKSWKCVFLVLYRFFAIRPDAGKTQRRFRQTAVHASSSAPPCECRVSTI